MDYDHYFPERVYTPEMAAGREPEFSVGYPSSAPLDESPAQVYGTGTPKAQIRVWIDRSPVLMTRADDHGYWRVDNPYAMESGEHEICVRSMYAGVCLESWVLFSLAPRPAEPEAKEAVTENIFEAEDEAAEAFVMEPGREGAPEEPEEPEEPGEKGESDSGEAEIVQVNAEPEVQDEVEKAEKSV